MDLFGFREAIDKYLPSSGLVISMQFKDYFTFTTTTGINIDTLAGICHEFFPECDVYYSFEYGINGSPNYFKWRVECP